MEQSSKGTSAVYRKLSSKDKEALALLGGTPIMDVIIRAIDLYQKDKAVFSMAMAPDFNNVLINRGEVQGARWIVDLIDYTNEKKETALKAKEAIAEQEKTDK